MLTLWTVSWWVICYTCCIPDRGGRDLLAVKNIYVDSDEVFVEGEATIHKSARSADAKTKLLPVVAPASGINGKCWAKTYFSLRSVAGLSLPGEQPGFMLPAPSDCASEPWTSRYLTSQEMNVFLRRIFDKAGLRDETKKLTTHSFKTTAMSWCSKFGVGDSARAVLARRCASVQGATAVYSRDLATAPLRLFLHVIKQIEASCFNPDATRSGMITPKARVGTSVPETPQPPMGFEEQQIFHEQRDEVEELQSSAEIGYQEFQVKREQLWVADNDGVIDLTEMDDDQGINLLAEAGGSSSESSSDGSSDEDSDEMNPTAEQGLDVPLLFGGMKPKWVINVNSLVIHELRTDDRCKCGRKFSKSFVPVSELNGFRCGRCFPAP